MKMNDLKVNGVERPPKDGHVLFCSDDGGFPQLLMAIHSLLKAANPARKLRISVFTGGENCISDEHVETLSSLTAKRPFATLEVVDITSFLEKYRNAFYSPGVHGGMFTWARCFMGEIFEKECGNLVYLDIDTFVCVDLGALYDLDLGENVIAAVYEDSREEAADDCNSHWTGGLVDLAAERYFNAGVGVFNLSAVRAENLLSRAVNWYATHRDSAACYDQDALNALCWNRVLPLPTAYNYSDGWCERQLKYSVRDKWWRGNAPQDVLDAIISPRIIHFWGPKKPWKWNRRPERKRYERAMREVGLLAADGHLEGSTVSRQILAALSDGYHAFLRQVAHYRRKRLVAKP